MLRLAIVWRALFGLLCVSSVTGAGGQSGGPDPHSRVTLVSEADALVPGTTAMIGLWFEIDEGWHIYQASQNDTGLEPTVEWASDAPLEFGGIEWPAGHRFTQPGEILDHGYEGSVLLMIPVEVPSDLDIGRVVEIRADLEWLACDAELCVPGFAELSLTLPVRASSEASGDSSRFEAARRALGVPVRDASDDGPAMAWEGSTLVVRAAGDGHLSFVPGPGGARVQGLFDSGVSETGELRLDFEEGEAPVIGWVRVGGAAGAESVAWRVRTPVGG